MYFLPGLFHRFVDISCDDQFTDRRRDEIGRDRTEEDPLGYDTFKSLISKVEVIRSYDHLSAFDGIVFFNTVKVKLHIGVVESDVLTIHIDVDDVGLTHKCGNEEIARFAVDLDRLIDLLDIAIVHDRDTIGYG